MPAITTLDSGPLLIIITGVGRDNHTVSILLNVIFLWVACLPVKIRGLVGLSLPTINTLLIPV